MESYFRAVCMVNADEDGEGGEKTGAGSRKPSMTWEQRRHVGGF